MLLRILLLALLTIPALAQDSTRIFLVDLGQPGLQVDINGHQGLTDARGTLQLKISIADGAALRFRSLDPAWVLDLSRQVPADDPTIPVLWDLTSELRPADLRPAKPSQAKPSRVQPSQAQLRPAPARPDPCRDPSSLFCRQAHWRRFEKAMARGDCSATLGALGELESKFPELLSSEAGVLALTKAHLDCGIRNQDPSLIRRALEKALARDDGILWCRPAASRLLARSFEALGEPGAAASSARTARPRCQPEDTAALEWEFYFRIRLGENESASALAHEAPQRLGLFLKAWLDNTRGVCENRVELEATGDLPCRGLPQEFCSRQYGRLLLTCGGTVDDFTIAARYLRAALPADPGDWSHLSARRELILELAEAEILSGDRRSALQLYSRARDTMEPDPLTHAVVMNNLCVLRVRLDETMTSREIALDLEALETAVGQVSEQEPRLHLRLRHNALSLRIRQLEKATHLEAQEKLSRLRELRAPFTDYQRELVSLNENAPPRVLAGAENLLEIFDQQGRRFAVAVP